MTQPHNRIKHMQTVVHCSRQARGGITSSYSLRERVFYANLLLYRRRILNCLNCCWCQVFQGKLRLLWYCRWQLQSQWYEIVFTLYCDTALRESSFTVPLTSDVLSSHCNRKTLLSLAGRKEKGNKEPTSWRASQVCEQWRRKCLAGLSPLGYEAERIERACCTQRKRQEVPLPSV